MEKETRQQKLERKKEKELTLLLLLLFGLGFSMAGVIRIFITGPSFGIHSTRLHFKVIAGGELLIFGILFLIGWWMAKRYYKKAV